MEFTATLLIRDQLVAMINHTMHFMYQLETLGQTTKRSSYR